MLRDGSFGTITKNYWIPAVSSHELWGVIIRYEILRKFYLPALWLWMVILVSMGFSLPSWKTELGIVRLGGAGGGNTGGSRWQACGRSKENGSSLPPAPTSQSHSSGRTSGHSDGHSTLVVASREFLSLLVVRPPCGALRMGFCVSTSH